jgi:hypothetical protein
MILAFRTDIPVSTMLRWSLAFVFFAVGASCGLWSSLIHLDAIDKVNEHLPPSEQLPTLFPGLNRAQTRSEYERLFPSGNHFDRERVLTVIMFIAFVGLAITAFPLLANH